MDICFFLCFAAAFRLPWEGSWCHFRRRWILTENRNRIGVQHWRAFSIPSPGRSGFVSHRIEISNTTYCGAYIFNNL
jgi:hypothetical protein